ncbi:MAG: phosphoribosylformylglycinamidine synthase subunit PurQ [Chitinophagales bacterium]
MKFGVVIFPGSNCDKDMIHVCKNVLKKEVVELWHKSTDLSSFTSEDCIILPGGFSFGDYLRTGAIARFSPIMASVIKHAENGGKVLGICNGFQILCESGLLPGVLLRNKNQKFYCENRFIRVEQNISTYTQNNKVGQILKIPVAHAEGRYHCDENTLRQIQANNQILFRYCEMNGAISETGNFNGSLDNIAGLMNKNGNVFGMMPHPERASEAVLGNTDGLAMLLALAGEKRAFAV